MWTVRHSLGLRREGFEGTRDLSSQKLRADPYTGCSRYFGSCKIATKDTLFEMKFISESLDCLVGERTIPAIAARKGGCSSPP